MVAMAGFTLSHSFAIFGNILAAKLLTIKSVVIV